MAGGREPLEFSQSFFKVELLQQAYLSSPWMKGSNEEVKIATPEQFSWSIIMDNLQIKQDTIFLHQHRISPHHLSAGLKQVKGLLLVAVVVLVKH